MDGNKGFTLIEVLIYSALLAIFFGGSISLLGDMLESSKGASERNELIFAQESIERKLEWIISGTVEIQSPSTNSSSSILTVILEDSTTVSFFEEEGVLKIVYGGGEPINLTNERIKISNFSATNISSANLSTGLKIIFLAETVGGKNYSENISLFHVLKR